MADIQALTRSHAVRQFGAGDPVASRATATVRVSVSAGTTSRSRSSSTVPSTRSGARSSTRSSRRRRWPCSSPRIRARANELIDGFVDQGEVDAYVEWCDPLPSSIFLSIMGIPQSEREHFVVVQERHHLAGPVRPPEPTEEREAAFTDCEKWFARRVRSARALAATYGDDIIGWLLHAEVDGRHDHP